MLPQLHPEIFRAFDLPLPRDPTNPTPNAATPTKNSAGIGGPRPDSIGIKAHAGNSKSQGSIPRPSGWMARTYAPYTSIHKTTHPRVMGSIPAAISTVIGAATNQPALVEKRAAVVLSPRSVLPATQSPRPVTPALTVIVSVLPGAMGASATAGCRNRSRPKRRRG